MGKKAKNAKKQKNRTTQVNNHKYFKKYDLNKKDIRLITSVTDTVHNSEIKIIISIFTSWRTIIGRRKISLPSIICHIIIVCYAYLSISIMCVKIPLFSDIVPVVPPVPASTKYPNKSS